MERLFPTFPYDMGDLPLSGGEPRTWFDARTGQGRHRAPLPGDDGAAGAVRALFVNGPMNVARHVLGADAVTLGRGPGVDIVVDDPCVSRAHVRIEIGDLMTLTD